ncbi:reticulocyte-binding protein 2-like isoform X2 [Sitophilus oryzae]|uniref:Reticulocyte-binding protein 2-like isoform X2 n=1 Tax=Sitophilus oryzae TaxID=7048 RepID=A0A6J2YJR3_SITOR|nr:reticulocyte-binding protein 2-like isoform X2 [Sitophilus oryzae]
MWINYGGFPNNNNINKNWAAPYYPSGPHQRNSGNIPGCYNNYNFCYGYPENNSYHCGTVPDQRGLNFIMPKNHYPKPHNQTPYFRKRHIPDSPRGYPAYEERFKRGPYHDNSNCFERGYKAPNNNQLSPNNFFPRGSYQKRTPWTKKPRYNNNLGDSDEELDRYIFEGYNSDNGSPTFKTRRHHFNGARNFNESKRHLFGTQQRNIDTFRPKRYLKELGKDSSKQTINIKDSGLKNNTDPENVDKSEVTVKSDTSNVDVTKSNTNNFEVDKLAKSDLNSNATDITECNKKTKPQVEEAVVKKEIILVKNSDSNTPFIESNTRDITESNKETINYLEQATKDNNPLPTKVVVDNSNITDKEELTKSDEMVKLKIFTEMRRVEKFEKPKKIQPVVNKNSSRMENTRRQSQSCAIQNETRKTRASLRKTKSMNDFSDKAELAKSFIETLDSVCKNRQLVIKLSKCDEAIKHIEMNKNKTKCEKPLSKSLPSKSTIEPKEFRETEKEITNTNRENAKSEKCSGINNLSKCTNKQIFNGSKSEKSVEKSLSNPSVESNELKQSKTMKICDDVNKNKIINSDTKNRNIENTKPDKCSEINKESSENLMEQNLKGSKSEKNLSKSVSIPCVESSETKESTTINTYENGEIIIQKVETSVSIQNNIQENNIENLSKNIKMEPIDKMNFKDSSDNSHIDNTFATKCDTIELSNMPLKDSSNKECIYLNDELEVCENSENTVNKPNIKKTENILEDNKRQKQLDVISISENLDLKRNSEEENQLNKDVDHAKNICKNSTTETRIPSEIMDVDLYTEEVETSDFSNNETEESAVQDLKKSVNVIQTDSKNDNSRTNCAIKCENEFVKLFVTLYRDPSETKSKDATEEDMENSSEVETDPNVHLISILENEQGEIGNCNNFTGKVKSIELDIKDQHMTKAVDKNINISTVDVDKNESSNFCLKSKKHDPKKDCINIFPKVNKQSKKSTSKINKEFTRKIKKQKNILRNEILNNPSEFQITKKRRIPISPDNTLDKKSNKNEKKMQKHYSKNITSESSRSVARNNESCSKATDTLSHSGKVERKSKNDHHKDSKTKSGVQVTRDSESHPKFDAKKIDKKQKRSIKSPAQTDGIKSKKYKKSNRECEKGMCSSEPSSSCSSHTEKKPVEKEKTEFNKGLIGDKYIKPSKKRKKPSCSDPPKTVKIEPDNFNEKNNSRSKKPKGDGWWTDRFHELFGCPSDDEHECEIKKINEPQIEETNSVAQHALRHDAHVTETELINLKKIKSKDATRSITEMPQCSSSSNKDVHAQKDIKKNREYTDSEAKHRLIHDSHVRAAELVNVRKIKSKDATRSITEVPQCSSSGNKDIKKNKEPQKDETNIETKHRLTQGSHRATEGIKEMVQCSSSSNKDVQTEHDTSKKNDIRCARITDKRRSTTDIEKCINAPKCEGKLAKIKELNRRYSAPVVNIDIGPLSYGKIVQHENVKYFQVRQLHTLPFEFHKITAYSIEEDECSFTYSICDSPEVQTETTVIKRELETDAYENCNAEEDILTMLQDIQSENDDFPQNEQNITLYRSDDESITNDNDVQAVSASLPGELIMKNNQPVTKNVPYGQKLVEVFTKYIHFSDHLHSAFEVYINHFKDKSMDYDLQQSELLYFKNYTNRSLLNQSNMLLQEIRDIEIPLRLQFSTIISKLAIKIHQRLIGSEKYTHLKKLEVFSLLYKLMMPQKCVFIRIPFFNELFRICKKIHENYPETVQNSNTPISSNQLSTQVIAAENPQNEVAKKQITTPVATQTTQCHAGNNGMSTHVTAIEVCSNKDVTQVTQSDICRYPLVTQIHKNKVAPQTDQNNSSNHMTSQFISSSPSMLSSPLSQTDVFRPQTVVTQSEYARNQISTHVTQNIVSTNQTAPQYSQNGLNTGQLSTQVTASEFSRNQITAAAIHNEINRNTVANGTAPQYNLNEVNTCQLTTQVTASAFSRNKITALANQTAPQYSQNVVNTGQLSTQVTASEFSRNQITSPANQNEMNRNVIANRTASQYNQNEVSTCQLTTQVTASDFSRNQITSPANRNEMNRNVIANRTASQYNQNEVSTCQLTTQVTASDFSRNQITSPANQNEMNRNIIAAQNSQGEIGRHKAAPQASKPRKNSAYQIYPELSKENLPYYMPTNMNNIETPNLANRQMPNYNVDMSKGHDISGFQRIHYANGPPPQPLLQNHNALNNRPSNIGAPMNTSPMYNNQQFPTQRVPMTREIYQNMIKLQNAVQQPNPNILSNANHIPTATATNNFSTPPANQLQFSIPNINNIPHNRLESLLYNKNHKNTSAVYGNNLDMSRKNQTNVYGHRPEYQLNFSNATMQNTAPNYHYNVPPNEMNNQHVNNINSMVNRIPYQHNILNNSPTVNYNQQGLDNRQAFNSSEGNAIARTNNVMPNMQYMNPYLQQPVLNREVPQSSAAQLVQTRPVNLTQNRETEQNLWRFNNETARSTGVNVPQQGNEKTVNDNFKIKLPYTRPHIPHTTTVTNTNSMSSSGENRQMSKNTNRNLITSSQESIRENLPGRHSNINVPTISSSTSVQNGVNDVQTSEARSSVSSSPRGNITPNSTIGNQHCSSTRNIRPGSFTNSISAIPRAENITANVHTLSSGHMLSLESIIREQLSTTTSTDYSAKSSQLTIGPKLMNTSSRVTTSGFRNDEGIILNRGLAALDSIGPVSDMLNCSSSTVDTNSEADTTCEDHTATVARPCEMVRNPSLKIRQYLAQFSTEIDAVQESPENEATLNNQTVEQLKSTQPNSEMTILHDEVTVKTETTDEELGTRDASSEIDKPNQAEATVCLNEELKCKEEETENNAEEDSASYTISVQKLCICNRPAVYNCICLEAWYCGTECQNKDWACHQNNCHTTVNDVGTVEQQAITSNVN